MGLCSSSPRALAAHPDGGGLKGHASAAPRNAGYVELDVSPDQAGADRRCSSRCSEVCEETQCAPWLRRGRACNATDSTQATAELDGARGASVDRA